MASQPPQQPPALGLPAINTAILRGCQQPLAIRREGGGVDLEGEPKSSSILGQETPVCSSLTPDSRTSPKHCPRNPGWELGLQASLSTTRAQNAGTTLVVRGKNLEPSLESCKT